MALGDDSRIFNNRIEPDLGSGIEIFRQRNIDIFNNTFRIRTSPPTCEYGNGEYSTAAVRIADYLAKPGSPRAAYGNRVYNNKISITAIDFPENKSYIPLSWAVYYSASGGDNDVFGNDITINKVDAASKADAAAFYICGGLVGFGGKFYDNRITANVPAIWLASFYGGAVNSKIYGNTITRPPETPAGVKPIRIGYRDCADCVAKNIEFRSNKVEGASFDIQASDEHHSWSVYWTLTVKVKDRTGQPAKDRSIMIFDKRKKTVASGKTDENGMLSVDLLEYSIDGKKKTDDSSYTVTVGGVKKEVALHEDMTIQLISEG